MNNIKVYISKDYKKVLQLRNEIMHPSQNLDYVKSKNDINGVFCLIQKDEQIIGSASWVVNQENVVIYKVCIKNEYQGYGYGKKLINYIINQTSSLKLPLTLDARYSQHKFYEKFGFVKTGEVFIKYELNFIQMLKKS